MKEHDDTLITSGASRQSFFGQTSAALVAASLHVATVHDSVYNGAWATLFAAPAGGYKTDGIDTEFDASAKYFYRKAFAANIGVAHFFPGEVMTSGNHRAPLAYACLEFTYRFKLEHWNATTGGTENANATFTH
jgi:hypothetical protein